MKSITSVVVVLTLAFTAGVAEAQTQSVPINVNAWVIGGDFAPSGMVQTKGLAQPFGTVHTMGGHKALGIDEKKDPWLVAFVGYKPLGSFGGEVRGSKFGANGTSDGSVGQTEGTVGMWSLMDVTPRIVSSAPILNGPVGYMMKSSVKVSRVDFLGNYTFELPSGWLSVFAGLPILRMESSEEVARAQGFLLYTLNSDRSLSSVGIRENYNYSSTASTKATMFGLVGGVEGEYCLVGGLFFEGRLAVATFPWGSGAKSDGQFSATKDIYLVNASGGVTGTPTQTLAHLNWAPTAMPYSETVKGTVTAVDVKAGLKWRFGMGSSTLNLGLAIARSSLSNMPTSAGYVIKDPYAVGHGQFSPRTTTMSVWAPMVTIGVWF